MPTKLKATMKVDVAGGSTLSATKEIDAEAYDQIGATVPTGTPNTAEVDVQPGGSGKVQLLFITASSYPVDESSGAAQLSFTVDGGDPVDLDAPLLMVGTGAIKKFGAFNKVVFTNNSSEAVSVTILVGRDAVT